MGTGEDAGALASSAQKAEDARPAAGADAEGKPAGAEDTGTGTDDTAAGATDDGPAADAESNPAGTGDTEAGAEDTAAGADAGESGHRPGAPVWVAGMAALLAVLIAGVVVSIVFLGPVRSSDGQNSRRQAAAAVARKAVADLTTADYQNPQQYLDKLRGVATGTFLTTLTNAATGFKSVLVQGKVQTTGTVVDVGVQRVGTDTAQLSVLADITVKNSQTPNGSKRAYRLSVSMVSAGSRWLVSNVEFVQ
jgi:Mce-associated membrane protein